VQILSNSSADEKNNEYTNAHHTVEPLEKSRIKYLKKVREVHISPFAS